MKLDATHFQYQESGGVSPRSGIQSGPRRPGSPGAVRGFTLIELMISIALVLLLILGVNQVFTYTTQAVGAGEAINSAIRSSRAAQTQFASDFASLVPNGGGPNDAASIIISSRAFYAFSNAKDQAAQGPTAADNSNPNNLPVQAFLDLQGTGSFGDTTVNGDIVYPSTYNYRNHRLDVLSFFARGLFSRQTGNIGTFVDNMASQEAWIWYGHLQLPDNTSTFSVSTGNTTFPCMGSNVTNPNNYFGGQLVLGRVAMLLKEKNPDSTSGIISDGVAFQRFIDRTAAYPVLPALAADVEPLCGSANAAFANGDNNPWQLQDSRFDLAATSILAYRNKLQSYIANIAVNASVAAWWDQLMDGNTSPTIALSPAGIVNRFRCIPFVRKPMSSQDMAQASPYFVGGCSQFTVEFAGDFVTQDNNPAHVLPRTGHAVYGDVTGPGPDGQIDYVINPTTGQKVISWYGMPRTTGGSGASIQSANGDVAPVRDRFETMYDATTGAPLTSPYASLPLIPQQLSPAQQYSLAKAGFPIFEKYAPAYPAGNLGDYSGKNGMTASEAQIGYTCAFGPTYTVSDGSGNSINVTDPHPKLIRITITLDDPTGRLPDGQTYQYVYALP